MSFLKKNTYQMDIDAANSTLQNIFATCDKVPNTIPFNNLLLRQKANTRIYNKLLIFTALILLLTFLVPIMIVPLANVMEQILAPTPVVILNDYLEGDILYLQLAGDNILYDKAYIQTLDGHREHAITYDTQKQLIGFPYNGEEESNIYIPIENQEPLHLLLSPQ